MGGGSDSTGGNEAVRRVANLGESLLYLFGSFLTLDQLRKYHSRIRSHYVSDMKGVLLSLFELKQLEGDPEKLAERVQYLLENDRFLCPEEDYTVCRVVQSCRKC